MELGSRIEGWLNAKGRTRRELATYCGVTLSAVCLWVGEGKPTFANLQKIIAFFGLTPEQFYSSIPKAKKKAHKASKPKRAAA